MVNDQCVLWTDVQRYSDVNIQQWPLLQEAPILYLNNTSGCLSGLEKQTVLAVHLVIMLCQCLSLMHHIQLLWTWMDWKYPSVTAFATCNLACLKALSYVWFQVNPADFLINWVPLWCQKDVECMGLGSYTCQERMLILFCWLVCGWHLDYDINFTGVWLHSISAYNVTIESDFWLTKHALIRV